MERWRKLVIFLCGIFCGHLLLKLQTPYLSWTQNVNRSNKSQQGKRPYKILCYINTYVTNYDKQAIHAHNTWARKCDKHVFTAPKPHPVLPIIGVNLTGTEGRQHLWKKMLTVLPHLYKFYDQYDYFLKADDDSYIIMENFRELLRDFPPDKPFLMGYKWPSRTVRGFVSGGPCYLLSRETLKRLVEQSLGKLIRCPDFDGDKEDVKINSCAENVGVQTYDSYDKFGIAQFQQYSLVQHITYLMNTIPLDRSKLRHRKDRFTYVGRNLLPFSYKHIGFHYITADQKYIMEFFIRFFTLSSPTQMPDD